MRITVNGEGREIEDGATIAELLDRLRAERNQPGSLSFGACAVEVNQSLVGRRQHPERRLTAGDAVEIVTLVGGG